MESGKRKEDRERESGVEEGAKGVKGDETAESRGEKLRARVLDESMAADEGVTRVSRRDIYRGESVCRVEMARRRRKKQRGGNMETKKKGKEVCDDDDGVSTRRR